MRPKGRSLKDLPFKLWDKVRGTVIRPFNGHKATIYGNITDIQVRSGVTSPDKPYHGYESPTYKSVPEVQGFRVTTQEHRHVDLLASDFGKTVVPEDPRIRKEVKMNLKNRPQRVSIFQYHKIQKERKRPIALSQKYYRMLRKGYWYCGHCEKFHGKRVVEYQIGHELVESVCSVGRLALLADVADSFEPSDFYPFLNKQRMK